jgi:hypothetical protein
LEAHKTHGVHSVGDFLLEILMIVIGVMIALGVEQVRVRFHEQGLARQARDIFGREIELERKVVSSYLVQVADSRAALDKIMNDPRARSQANLDLPKTLIWQFLPAQAWDTAVATQAFSYMPPDEVQRYALIHADQNVFNDFAQKQHDILIDLYSYTKRSDLTSAEIAARNRDVDLIRGYLSSVDQISHELLRNFDALAASPEK